MLLAWAVLSLRPDCGQRLVRLPRDGGVGELKGAPSKAARSCVYERRLPCREADAAPTGPLSVDRSEPGYVSSLSGVKSPKLKIDPLISPPPLQF